MRAIPLWQQQLLIAAIVSLPLGTGLPAYAQVKPETITVAKQSNKTAFKHVAHRNERAPVIRARPDSEYADRQRPRSILDVPVNQLIDRVPRNNNQNNIPASRNIVQPRSSSGTAEAQPGSRANAAINNNFGTERLQRSNIFMNYSGTNSSLLKRGSR
jgi:hypothetical protein